MTRQLPTDGRHITYQVSYRRCCVCKACKAGGKGHGPYLYAFWRDTVTKKMVSKYMGKTTGAEGMV